MFKPLQVKFIRNIIVISHGKSVLTVRKMLKEVNAIVPILDGIYSILMFFHFSTPFYVCLR